MAELPPGQRERDDLPRFGLHAFATRIPELGPAALTLRTGAGDLLLDAARLEALPRVEQVSDFHCVTTWSTVGLRWSGWRLRDVWEHCCVPLLDEPDTIDWLLFRCADGFRARLLLEDALNDDVLLAYRLGGEPLPLQHGGPLRLVAPQHYGYKSAKYLTRIECSAGGSGFLPNTPLAMMEHPRGRVALEERGGWPGWLLRRLYPLLIRGTIRRFERGWSEAGPAPAGDAPRLENSTGSRPQ